jgi:hypothetical protein
LCWSSGYMKPNLSPVVVQKLNSGVESWCILNPLLGYHSLVGVGLLLLGLAGPGGISSSPSLSSTGFWAHWAGRPPQAGRWVKISLLWFSCCVGSDQGLLVSAVSVCWG